MPEELIRTDVEKKQNKITIKKHLPFIPLRDTVVFPHEVVPIAVERPKSLAALEASLKQDRIILFSCQKRREINNPSRDDIYAVGTVARITQVMRSAGGAAQLIADGIARVRIINLENIATYQVAHIEPLVVMTECTPYLEALVRTIINQFKQVISLGRTVPVDVLIEIFSQGNDPERLTDLMVANLDFDVSQRQELLEASHTSDRLKKLSKFLAEEIEISKVERKLQSETQKSLGKMQKEVFLREQMRAIEKELGISEEEGEFSDIAKKIEEVGMPKKIQERARKEFDRLKKMPPFSPETSYIRTYLEWLTDLPWNKQSKIKIDVKKAEKTLDEQHYGLGKVKERILEYLAVQKLSGKIRGPILCFAGPPGTGKTSIGKSIAESLGREFVRVSVGGIRDEAEIRGHRRTYVGALPGRIIQGIKKAGTKNPVFMLDEIDKIGTDFRGDPSSALLEALDPEQNKDFSDHYIEEPFDLSGVMFITTANVLDTIPPPLRDRMEVIEFSSYIEDEKFHIAKKFLLPKIMEEHGLKKASFVLEDDALRHIIQKYTREAGVRNLERTLAKIARKVARKITEGGKKRFTVGVQDIRAYLGTEKYKHTVAEEKDEVGVSTGLAWTEAGGEILFIEATKMPGKGNLILTGQLGEVMKESAQAAFSFIKSRAKILQLAPNAFEKIDVHVHVPEGAIPKDGPSAGVAMATTLASLMTGKKVRREVGMTGEITLRGRILEIGGVKEKVLAAHRAGVEQVLLPKDNEKDLDDIPDDVRKKLKFTFVAYADDALKIALKK